MATVTLYSMWTSTYTHTHPYAYDFHLHQQHRTYQIELKSIHRISLGYRRSEMWQTETMLCRCFNADKLFCQFLVRSAFAFSVFATIMKYCANSVAPFQHSAYSKNQTHSSSDVLIHRRYVCHEFKRSRIHSISKINRNQTKLCSISMFSCSIHAAAFFAFLIPTNKKIKKKNKIKKNVVCIPTRYFLCVLLVDSFHSIFFWIRWSVRLILFGLYFLF